MGLFTKKKKEDSKKVDTSTALSAGDKSVKISNDKKSEKKESTKDLYKEEKVDKTKKTSETKEVKKVNKKYGNTHEVLVKPLITEKASIQGTEGKYFFAVKKDANKIEIAKAISDVYGVKPVSVNIMRIVGKKVRRGRSFGKRKDWKKAIVTLKKGESIKVYEGV